MDNQRGEIVTILTVISLGLMLIGIVAGKIAVQQATQTQSKAANNQIRPLDIPEGDCSRNPEICDQVTQICINKRCKLKDAPPTVVPATQPPATNAPQATNPPAQPRDCSDKCKLNSSFCYNECIIGLSGYAHSVSCSASGEWKVGNPQTDPACGTATITPGGNNFCWYNNQKFQNGQTIQYGAYEGCDGNRKEWVTIDLKCLLGQVVDSPSVPTGRSCDPQKNSRQGIGGGPLPPTATPTPDPWLNPNLGKSCGTGDSNIIGTCVISSYCSNSLSTNVSNTCGEGLACCRSDAITLTPSSPATPTPITEGAPCVWSSGVSPPHALIGNTCLVCSDTGPDSTWRSVDKDLFCKDPLTPAPAGPTPTPAPAVQSFDYDHIPTTICSTTFIVICGASRTGGNYGTKGCTGNYYIQQDSIHSYGPFSSSEEACSFETSLTKGDLITLTPTPKQENFLPSGLNPVFASAKSWGQVQALAVAGKVRADQISLWVHEAAKYYYPGIKTSFCDPMKGECDFRL